MDLNLPITIRKRTVLNITLVVVLSLTGFIYWYSHSKTMNMTQVTEAPTQQVDVSKDTEETVDVSDEEEGKWYTFHVKSGDTLSHIFTRAGLTQKTLQQVLQHNPHAKMLANLRLNQSIKLFIKEQTLEKLVLPINGTQYLQVSMNDGRYATEIKNYKITTQQEYLTATVDGSLYRTAQKHHIPQTLMRQMTDIFSWKIDFSKDAKAGNQFSIIYETLLVDDKPVGTGNILAVAYTTRSKRYEAIRHINAEGKYDYFSPDGVSLKKAFTRYPTRFSHISSTFNLHRKHPILNQVRPHKGIDLAAPIGTPIRATGDGRILFIGQKQGYGNVIKIDHQHVYTTVYGHMLRFQKGLSRGDTVTRGQVIGYVGQSGLATGPHCHYEFHVNHHPKNPATIELPHAAPIAQNELAAFSTHAGTMLAQLKLYEETSLAKADSISSGKHTG